MACILVADDDVEQIAVQRSLLEAMGYEVCAALSTSQTLAELDRRQPDLVVADLRFPRAIHGLALIRAIRGAGYAKPLIALSGWPDDLYGSPEEQLVSRILIKGSARELLDAIADLLSRG